MILYAKILLFLRFIMEFVFIPNLSELQAENCGIAILSPGWIHKKRNLSTSVLILGHQGKVSIQEESEMYCIQPSSFCLLSEGRNHWGAEELQEKARYYWIHFKTKEAPQFLSEKEALLIINNPEIARSRLHDALLLPRYMDTINTNVVRELFHALLYEQENKCFTEQKYQATVKLLLISLNETVMDIINNSKKNENNKSIVNKVIQLVYENLSDPGFSVKRLADTLCYNPDYLNRHFKSLMKRSLIEYIIDKRIEHSLVALIDSDKTISAIAEDSGFSSYRDFVHQFKRRKDMTPSNYRNYHRMLHITNS
ncbi:MAG: AraC family transcriptional regulator [Spirochaetia bacterium]|nr:AraC family transcriptional regulator [Spirochaetia bacterium]NCC89894.1 AraC family transcriptional regulator [Spirochaetia bacterium]